MFQHFSDKQKVRYLADVAKLLKNDHSVFAFTVLLQVGPGKGQMGKDEALFMARSIGGKKSMTDESKVKLRESCKLRTERQRANGVLEKANAKRSESHKGKKKSEEHMAAWSASRKGHKVSEETRAKIRATLAETRAKKKALQEG